MSAAGNRTVATGGIKEVDEFIAALPGSPAVEHALQTFHKYSVAVWLIWMVAYLSGAWLGMQGI